MHTSGVPNSPSSLPAVTRHVRNRRERAVIVSTAIMADRRQLLHALTLPEYLEAWITPADADSCHARVVMRSGTAYVMEYRNTERQMVSIDGVFRTASRNRVAFTWRTCWPKSTRRSTVNIALTGDFAFTTLQLTHSGVMDDLEFRSVRDLWDRSLHRLKLLIESGRNNAFEAPSIRRGSLSRFR